MIDNTNHCFSIIIIKVNLANYRPLQYYLPIFLTKFSIML